ncbi:hypothetical protein OROMI_009882 [Orobanche minor]
MMAWTDCSGKGPKNVLRIFSLCDVITQCDHSTTAFLAVLIFPLPVRGGSILNLGTQRPHVKGVERH